MGYYIPKSRQGKVSLATGIISMIFFSIVLRSVYLQANGLYEQYSIVAYTISFWCSLLFGSIACYKGVEAALSKKERSVLVVITSVLIVLYLLLIAIKGFPVIGFDYFTMNPNWRS
jgi:uncharacterized membrane protein (DUF485 family)